MHVRCQFCNHSFNLSREYVVQALARAEEKGHKYHGLECTNCRKLIKIPLAQMRRAVPEEVVEEAEEEETEVEE